MSRTNAHKVARLCTNFAYDKINSPNISDKFIVYGCDFVKPTMFTDIVWCISNRQAELLLKYFPQYHTKVKIFSNFRNINQIIELSEEFEVSFDKKVIIAIWRIEQEKRFDILLKAFAILNNDAE